MASRGVNKVILVGNLGNDPETKFTPSGNAVTNLSVATSESWKDKQTGQPQERTEWHRVVMFGKLAEIAGQYLRKGSKVYLEGKLQTRKWQDQGGQDRYTTEVVVDINGQMQMLDSRGDNAGAGMGGGMNNGGFAQQGQAPQGQTPQGQTPQGQTPQGQTPQGQTPQAQAPQMQAQPRQQAAPAQAAPQQGFQQAPQQSPQQAPQGMPMGGAAPQQQPAPAQSFDNFDDDIPF